MRKLFWELVSWPLGSLLWLWGQAILRTSKIEIHGQNYQGAALYVNWHRYLPFLCIHHGLYRRWILVSPAPYMQTIARWNQFSGLRLVRGATGQGGNAAIHEMIKCLERGDDGFIAVDGPAGPLYQVKRGCIEMAKRANVPIIPVAYESRFGKFSKKRWDNWLSIRLKDQITVKYGNPIWIERDENLETSQRRVEAGLASVSHPMDIVTKK